jgi:hypothetical protein
MGSHLLTVALSLFLNFHGIFQSDTLNIFNGTSLDGWDIIDFEGHGAVTVSDSCVIINEGLGISGIKWKGELPKINYEIELDAKRVAGSDFFCGVTFPVKETFNSFIIGGWGGSIVGLSCIDGEDAANNITYDFRKFDTNRWYKIRLRVTENKIEAWIDKDKVVDFTIGNYVLSLRWEAESCMPFGIATWQTKGALRNIKLVKGVE